ncbi:LOG family protein [Alkalihalobacillus alcalophilus ATCC 27647 = CGMCC 1.3604]|uniref:Cytokinin riboside 5'-monophosphate phosphoribohydrolase n=1 Tax=Alkalihalobacillus alcalophilus ATCC 27647 = CGMCC 1.3604 TaxID=1218173 RepID=A0A094YQ25_ALKAL|nr:TIGR00730 family Rossman fold protein [Alkalihalobacillus alcalophilus]KGA95582.1 decarboxylase [Alkalihalobacillus alcalophilus ATCC 27647 = CGMCC 1.3604]MED1562924.1 TIGR00730 family Rossman fold protein [Alkalihalobacillus alcalophilus]THG89658.1 LOG family protein [Alkalihalobacillus alcalophilus ATCC 27647 = CGMCC 1.3604]
MKRVAVFCGANEGSEPVYMERARLLGEEIAKNNLGLVYGGATVGCMGAVADAVMKAGGEVVGVIPEKLASVEVAHRQITELHIVQTMHERKAMMAEKADAFIALPGGAGTMEEWFEVLTWAHIGYHNKPCCLLNVNGYYTPLLELFEHMIKQGFVKESYRKLIIMEDEPAQLLQRILSKN